ncbi:MULTISPECIES: transcription repressor NadR [Anaerotruncus]|uniref:transcription repressor NadR n=2 Tax=Oscillospiraceae TaxID=216572 RepID=UPI00082C4023|nr:MULTISPECIES: transcription repressor NadR [Anaerotruncus]RGX55553.1 transcription repressor NadR [Anaerotruncus sp. AF02-27]
MVASERREKIKELLMAAGQPVSASVLAKQMGVSRQIIVGDIALLRASNLTISATPRGYILAQQSERERCYTVACKHGQDQIAQELYAVVDNGGGVIDVVVEHAVYGQISGQLHVFSRYDADSFLRKLRASSGTPLSALTGGVHLHTISCPDQETFRRICAALAEKGILFENSIH